MAVEEARGSNAFGVHSFISPKNKTIGNGMDAYVQQRNLEVTVRFDVICYTLSSGKWIRDHIENAFYPF